MLGPFRDVDGTWGLWGFRGLLRERGLLRDERIRAGLQLRDPLLAVGGGERSFLERREVAIERSLGARQLLPDAGQSAGGIFGRLAILDRRIRERLLDQ